MCYISLDLYYAPCYSVDMISKQLKDALEKLAAAKRAVEKSDEGNECQAELFGLEWDECGCPKCMDKFADQCDRIHDELKDRSGS